MANPLIERARWHLARETGAIIKPRGAALRVALVYPNTYWVGMSNLAVHALYHLFNAHPAVTCERAFAPDRGWERDRSLPLVTIETQTPLDRFDVIAFSLSYELDYINAVEALRRARVPIFARERGDQHPLVIAGGVCASFNPEPMAEICDAFVVGEAEPVMAPLMEALLAAGDRAGALRALQGLPGLYLPAAYEALYTPQGAFAGLAPRAGAAANIVRLQLGDLDSWPTRSRVLTPDTEFGNMFLIEISRGCAHACRFCVTSPCYRPYRYRCCAHVLAAATEGLKHRRAIGLVAAAASDHPHLESLVRSLRQMEARVALSSLRADGVSAELLQALSESGTRSLTLAPEAATERLRRRLRKNIGDEQYLAAARLAATSGIRHLRLYFMLGLPGETTGDVEAIPPFVHRLKREARLSAVTASVSAFVPKPHTAFEREPMAPVPRIAAQLRLLRSQLHAMSGVRMSGESPSWSFIQAALARGDRRLAAVIARAEEEGGSLAAWRSAFAAEKLPPEYFACRLRPAAEILPWEHIG